MKNFDMRVLLGLVAFFDRVKGDLDFFVDDVFEELPEVEKARVREYINDYVLVNDLRAKPDAAGAKEIRVLMGFPRANLAFPQVCIILASETPSTMFLGDQFDQEPTAVYPPGATNVTPPIRYDEDKKYMAEGTVFIDTLTTSWLETFWLARLVQRGLFELKKELTDTGYMKWNLNIADLTVDPTYLPVEAFGRRITFAMNFTQGYRKKIDYRGTYETGINEGLEGLD